MSKLLIKKTLLVLFLLTINSEFHAQKSEKLLIEKQKEFLSWKFGMFIHFNMGTFVNREWATGYEDPLLFNPKKLDCDQWAKAAKSAGMKYAVLTVKHTGGWCLWPSEYTEHGVQSFKNYKNGNGDIVREFVDAFRNNGMKVGFYYCLPGDYSTRWGNKEDQEKGYKISNLQKDLHGLAPEANGQFEQFIKNQIKELLQNYGNIDLLWFDQYTNKYTASSWMNFKNLVHELQPNCVVIANNSLDYKETDIYSYEYPYWSKINKMERAMPPENNSFPSEMSDCIVDGALWFYNDEIQYELNRPEIIYSRLKMSNERKSNYLLNVQPNKEGLISGEFMQRLKEIGKLTKN
jgi:alpha-L-fucosidase